MRWIVAGICLLLPFALGGCQDNGQNRTPTKLTLSGLDQCVATAKLTVTQDSKSESQDVSLTSGVGSAQFTKDFDWTKPLTVAVKVVTLANTPQCEGTKIAIGEVFGVSITATAGSGEYTVGFGTLDIHYQPTAVAGVGTVSAGQAPTIRGPGIALFTKLSGACKQTCWQQWVNTQVFWDDGATAKEIFKGKSFPVNGQVRHNFGDLARDLPPGSNNSCFREDAIPGEPPSTGILDAPNLPTVDSDFFGKVLLEVRARPPLKIHYRFSVDSVLWCAKSDPADPNDPKIIGYYHWSASQPVDFTPNPNPPPNISTTIGKSEVDKMAAWTQGAGTLTVDQKKF